MTKALLKTFFKNFTGIDFRVVFWDGEAVDYGSGEPLIKIVFNRKLPVNFSLADPVLSFGEAYVDGVIDFEGDLEEVIKIVELNRELAESKGLKKKLLSSIQNMAVSASRQRQKQNIQHHYDLGNDFFALWLDETMSYSCAYFRDPGDTLAEAQLQKIDLILKKLHLKPGERLLDIGCGWGWLIIRAARQYQVRALGITLSEEQYTAAAQRVKDLGLAGLVEVRLLNYLDLPEDQGQFDKIVSVGMFEHVGRENLAKYMEKVNKLLVPGGLSMLHTITGTNEHEVNSWIDKYIFPGGYIPSLRETIWLLPDHNFHLLHAESLRMHYAMTLDRWYGNFVSHIDEIRNKFGEKFIRMWSLYLRGCAASFRVSGLNVYQLLFSKGLNNNLPLTLEGVYCR
ncbi:MAG: cyclopropane-fatty-acyl-phospholipid synthase family protein [Peptococcaceae bacterium]|nr:cyclopropane-fatty-acyl-phospholipid synthase family protein [Peptococcaceae bacterium]